MKNKLIIFATALFSMGYAEVKAQDAFGEIIKSGQKEGEKLATAYLNPFGRGFGVGLNNSWLSAGEAFKPGRFEIRIIGSAALVPEDDKTFDLSALGYNTSTGAVRLADANDKIAPTIFGEDMDGPLLDIYAKRPDTGQEEKIASFNTPSGIGIGVVPTPMAQLNIGLIKKTELMVRFLPEVTKDDISAQMYGVGVKHNIGQWLPIIRDLPFSLIGSAGYTHFRASYLGINVAPATMQNNKPVQKTPQQSEPGYYDNQQLDLNTTATAGSLVVSVGKKAISAFAGVNYSNSVTNFNLNGTYPVTSIRETAPYSYYVEDIQDPIKVNMEQRQIGLTGGFRLKLAIFSLFAQGTYARYSSATAGIGIGWN